MPKLNKKYRFLAIILAVSLVLLRGDFLPQKAKASSEGLAIYSLNVSEVTHNSAKITWRTSSTSDAKVEFGVDTNYGNWVSSSLKDETYHTIILGGLAPQTTYHFRAISKNQEGNEIISIDHIFKTEEYEDKTLPIISQVRVSFVTGKTATIVWETDEEADSTVEYGLREEFDKRKYSSSKVKIHEITLTKLLKETYYNARVKSKDKSGNESVSQEFRFKTLEGEELDDADLIISNITPISGDSPQISQTSAQVTWQTNRPADGRVDYGESTRYGEKVSSTPPKSINHSFVLENLKEGTLYHFRVKSEDIFGKTAVSLDHIFTTKSATEVPEVPLLSINMVTKAEALYKTATSPDVYAILKGRKHLIPSPSVFREYGYRWEDIKVVAASQLDEYKDAKLVKLPHEKNVYFLYLEKKIKKAIPNEKVFLSYGHKWEEIVEISSRDLVAYSDIKLVKTQDKPSVYLLEGGAKKPIFSAEVFERRGYDWSKIGVVNKTDLDSYPTGEMIL
ncbi:MAG: hypothetical protein COY82_00680 [Parcubacteria group bacterium CG_4_10_14_0_8_um_filter_35_7]|nr:MAG: hypothetical protein COX43_02790 [Parcubacteria group bacterium CG23_combo_of_CG06-09_8_20_14_all_35_9]PIY78776.1 MAG: hypothetical protein COY82_00680 [Parcubacteria group bacterium CG_4_10_14_0_8_um_filter_35_7]